jgi:hypothetical protein
MRNQKIVLVSIYFNSNNIILSGYFDDQSGPNRTAGDPTVIPIVSTAIELGRALRKMHMQTISFTIDDVSIGHWTKATRIKSWKKFAQAYEAIDVQSFVGGDEITVYHLPFDPKHSSFGGISQIPKTVLPETATDEELGKAVLVLMQRIRDEYPHRFDGSEPAPPRISFKTIDDPQRNISYEMLSDEFEDAGDTECYQAYEMLGLNSYITLGYACSYEHTTRDEISERWSGWYGKPTEFTLESVEVGLFTRKAEWKSKTHHVVSHFNSEFSDTTCVLECQMVCDLKTTSAAKRRKLLAVYEKLLLSFREDV